MGTMTPDDMKKLILYIAGEEEETSDPFKEFAQAVRQMYDALKEQDFTEMQTMTIIGMAINSATMKGAN